MSAAIPLQLYAVFHLNLAFSSIEQARYPEVVQRCYWPLLRVLKQHGVPAGIELTGFTLETIQQIDSTWVTELRTMLASGQLELVGSGDTQLIGPLVPAMVNRANQLLGVRSYTELLDVQPRIALVNEQAYSAGVVAHYREAGYRALMMEWDNAASQHPKWSAEWRFLPQRVQGRADESMPVLWNHSISFQKFQRYAHGELHLDDYIDYLADQAGADVRALPLYGNDVEIFDFRPGRFHTEAALAEEREWHRISALFERLTADTRFVLRAPGAVLDLLDAEGAGKRLTLGTCAHPIPVKKQRKYNLSRWAISGRDDLWLNTVSHRCFQALRARDGEQPTFNEDWRRLCRIWASDWRTHIAEQRWHDALTQLDSLVSDLGVDVSMQANAKSDPVPTTGVHAQLQIEPDPQRHRLHINTPDLRVVFNTRRGMAIERLAFSSHGFEPVLGTLAHGYFESIELGADFYTGGVVIELPGEHRRIADLESVQPDVMQTDDEVIVSSRVKTDKGIIEKCFRIALDGERLNYEVRFPGWDRPKGVVRVGHFTLLPEAFDETLRYCCRNGGELEECFPMRGDCAHTDAASTLVSASTGLGATNGCLTIGDGRRGLRLRWDPAFAAAFPMIQHRVAQPGALTRVVFSLAELDETSRDGGRLLPFRVSLAPV